MNTKDSNETSPSSAAPAAPSAAAAAPAASARAAPSRARRFGLLGLGAVVLLSGLGYGGYWFFDGRYFESTDDGYVNGDVVQVTSEVPGTVLALNVDDTQLVAAGQPLLELDPASVPSVTALRPPPCPGAPPSAETFVCVTSFDDEQPEMAETASQDPMPSEERKTAARDIDLLMAPFATNAASAPL